MCINKNAILLLSVFSLVKGVMTVNWGPKIGPAEKPSLVARFFPLTFWTNEFDHRHLHSKSCHMGVPYKNVDLCDN